MSHLYKLAFNPLTLESQMHRQKCKLEHFVFVPVNMALSNADKCSS